MSEAHEARKNVIAARGWTDSLIRKHLTEYLGVEHRYGYGDCEYYFYDADEVSAKEIVPEIAAALARNLDKRAARRASALKGVATRKRKMETWAETVELTIERGWTDEQLEDLSFRTHGGNYAGKPRGAWHWNNQTAVNTIRHRLTNYEELWEGLNRGTTGTEAYLILRGRIDALIAEAYPRFSDEKIAAPEADV